MAVIKVLIKCWNKNCYYIVHRIAFLPKAHHRCLLRVENCTKINLTQVSARSLIYKGDFIVIFLVIFQVGLLVKFLDLFSGILVFS